MVKYQPTTPAWWTRRWPNTTLGSARIPPEFGDGMRLEASGTVVGAVGGVLDGKIDVVSDPLYPSPGSQFGGFPDQRGTTAMDMGS